MTHRKKTKDDFLAMDAADPLACERQKYSLPEGTTYFVGNSLGAMPKASRERILQAVEQEWAHGLVESWNNADWINLPERIGSKIATLIGASGHEVVVADSTSVNLAKLIVAALQLKPGRKTIITESSSFPTDLYIMQGIANQLSSGVEIKTLDRDEIKHAVDENTALLVLSHVDYRTGELLDMDEYSNIAHDAGALILWDLCHSAGVIDVELNKYNADFAVGCGYKYLNGGPGAPAFIYVADRWIATINQPLTGWMGHQSPFEFSQKHKPADNIKKMLTGTPPVLAASCLEGAVDTLLEADIQLVRQKSMQLGQLMIELMQQFDCESFGFELVSPQIAVQRGSQVCYQHEYGYAIIKALIAKGFLADYRNPGVLRFGFAPVYQRYIDVWNLVSVLVDIMERESWKVFKDIKQQAVT